MTRPAYDEVRAARDTKQETINAHADALRAVLIQVEQGIRELTSSPSGSYADDNLHLLNLIRTARDACTMRAENIAFAANREPDSLTLPPLAEALGVSVNTLRTRMPTIKQGHTNNVASPF